MKLENSYVKDEPKKEMKLIINVERLMTNAEENFKNKVEIQNVWLEIKEFEVVMVNLQIGLKVLSSPTPFCKGMLTI